MVIFNYLIPFILNFCNDNGKHMYHHIKSTVLGPRLSCTLHTTFEKSNTKVNFSFRAIIVIKTIGMIRHIQQMKLVIGQKGNKL